MKKLFIGLLTLTSLSSFAASYSDTVSVYKGGGRKDQTVILLKNEAARELMARLPDAEVVMDDYYEVPRKILRGKDVECHIEAQECYLHILTNGKVKSSKWEN